MAIGDSTTVPICTGEDIYLAEGFEPLLTRRAVSVIHPDILTSGGILENKRIGDLAQRHGVAMAVHLAEMGAAAVFYDGVSDDGLEDTVSNVTHLANETMDYLDDCMVRVILNKTNRTRVSPGKAVKGEVQR